MPLDGAIDLHANHSVVVFRNEQDQVIDHRRFTNDLPEILAPLPRIRQRSKAWWCNPPTTGTSSSMG